MEELGEIVAWQWREDGAELTVRAPLVCTDAAHGDSIAVNGVCLTVVEATGDRFRVDVMHETVRRSALAATSTGDRVNLERAVTPSTRLGGHIVQGHVDGVGTVRRVERVGDAVLVDVEVPAQVAEVLVPHGSITVDGVSLTVNAIPARQVVQLSLIEYTLRHTTLGALAPGDAVHVEGDVIGKFVRQLVTPYLSR